MTQPLDTRPIYYVYVLFDHNGLPRYVGKGKGRRWLQHEDRIDPNNSRKNTFIQDTLAAIGEIPKIKVREGIIECEAFEIESALIKAIGRSPHGPLVNLTDTRNGPSSETTRTWHASRTPEERKASAAKTQATILAKYTVEERSERARGNALGQGREGLSERMALMQASRSKEARSAAGRKGGLASAFVKTPEMNAAHGEHLRKWHENATPEQIRANYEKSGIATASKAQKAAWSRANITKTNQSRTAQERRDMARKAGLASARVRRRAKSDQTNQSSFDFIPSGNKGE